MNMLRGLLLSSLLGGMAAAERPEVQRVDPPNWFAGMPDPMLLIRGTGLGGAEFRVADIGVRVLGAKVSPNGHWAIVTLETHRAAAGTLRIMVRTAGGETSFVYRLGARRAAADGPRGFSSRDVMYLIMPDRFAQGEPARAAVDRTKARAYHGGDLEGITRHLDYLEEMGVTAVWLTPILENSRRRSDYHGYGATDMYAVEPRLGTLADYRRLADELHRRGMKLIFDDVPNHVGQDHPWVDDAPEANWFHGTAANHVDNEYRFPPVTDPHAAANMSRDALDGWFANILPDLNQENPDVAKYLTENMVWWIEEAGIDGLRIDTFPYVPRDFWQGYLGELSRLYPRLTAVGEVEDGNPTVVSYFAGGRVLAGVDTHLTTPFDYPMFYKLLDVLVKGRPMSELEDTLRQDWLYPHPEALVPFLGNHDQPRFVSQPGSSPALLRMGFGLVLTMRGTPQLYAGDEVLLEGGGDPDNRRDFPGSFPGDRVNGFTAEGRSAPQNAMHDWVAALGKLRGRTPALQTGRQETVVTGETTFAYVRSLGAGSACSAGHDGSMLVVANRGTSAAPVRIPIGKSVLVGCHESTAVLGDGSSAGLPSPVFDETALTVSLPAFGIAVYALR